MAVVMLRQPAAACLVAAILALAACSGSTGPAATAAGGVSMSWEVVDPDPASEAGPESVVAWRDGYVGIGSGRSWASKDGRTWTSTLLPGDASGVELVVAGERLVAAGTVGSGMRAVVWTSSDGATWTESNDAGLRPVAGFESTRIDSLAAGPGGIVTVGTEWGSSGQRAAAWYSADGIEWVRSTAPLVGSGARDVAAVGDGFVMVGAADAVGGEPTRAAFWFSADGRTWTPAADDGVRGGKEPEAVTASEAGLVSVGYRTGLAQLPEAMAPMAWTSGDGRAWSAVVPSGDMSPWPFPGASPVTNEGALWGSSMWDVEAFPSGLLAIGVCFGLDPAAPLPDGMHQMVTTGAVWRSSDGNAWSLIDPGLPGLGRELAVNWAIGFGLRRVVNVNGNPIVIGTTSGGGSQLWLGTFVGD